MKWNTLNLKRGSIKTRFEQDWVKQNLLIQGKARG